MTQGWQEEAWAMLVAAGNAAEVVAATAGVASQRVLDAVRSAAGATSRDQAWDWHVHRRRLALRAALDRADRTDAAGCWITRARTSPEGHGQLRALGTNSQPRVILMVTSGRLATREVARHTCGIPGCCRPDHLRWGSRADNNADRRLHRRGKTLAPRSADEIRHMDVLDVAYVDLRSLAIVEQQLSRLDPVDGGCLMRRGTAGNTWYTTVHVAGGTQALHRFVVSVAGVDLPPGHTRIVNHRCARKPCARLACLEVTTSAGNRRAALASDLAPRGQAHPRAAMTDADVLWAREQLAANKASQAELAERLAVSHKVVDDVVRGRTYHHLGGPLTPAHRRLSDRGVQTVRTMVAFGAAPAILAQRLGLGPSYVRELAYGQQRVSAGGPVLARPGAARGSRVATARLTAAQVRIIDQRVAAGEGLASIARQLGIDPSTAARAHQRHTWKHVPA